MTFANSIDGLTIRPLQITAERDASYVSQWCDMLRLSWGSDYILRPEVEIAKIGNSDKPGFAVGAIHPKGFLLAAQAVNWSADPRSWGDHTMYWSAVTTQEGWQHRGLCKILYSKCATWMHRRPGRIGVPFEKLNLVPFLFRRGWRFSNEPAATWCYNEAGQVGLFMELSRPALDDYIKNPF